MKPELMPQRPGYGECAYCVRSVEKDRLPERTPRGPRALERFLRSFAVACRSCEGHLIAGHQPPVAGYCGSCKGTGRELCPGCGGTREDGGEPCAQCDEHGRVRCYDCQGRGMSRCAA